MTGPEELLQQLCHDLRLLWTEAGGPSQRILAMRVGLGKSQISAILNGKIHRPPDWEVIKCLIDNIRHYAHDHDRHTGLSLRTGINEYWRPRYALLEHAFRHTSRHKSSAGQSDAPAAAARIEPRAMPRQLPATVTHFAGRSAELAALAGLLDQHADNHNTVVISAIGGTAGIGKTALALHWAHHVRERFPDGQLYVNLRGFDPTDSVLEPAAAIRGFLDALGVAPQRIPPDLNALTALYRSELAQRRMLILLDNARDSTQVRPLLPGTPDCLVLVTSRNHLTGLIATDSAHPITLDLLTTTEARELLTRRLGPDRITAEPDTVEEIITRCARLPLALTIVAARAAAYPHLPLHALASELRDTSGRLNALTTDDPTTDVRAVFSWSYRTLTPDTARLFRLLGLHPGPDLSAAAAVSLAAQPQPRVRAQLAELVRANLLVEHTPGRYTFHDLLRTYATEQAHTIDTAQQRHTATRRILDHYLHTAHAAAVLINPQLDAIQLPLEPSTAALEPITDDGQAWAWLDAERPNMLAAVTLAATSGFDRHTWQLAWTLVNVLYRQGYWHELHASQTAGLDAAQRLGNLAAQAASHRRLAAALTQLGRFDESADHLRRALDLWTALGDAVGQAHATSGINQLYASQGRHAEALPYALTALDLYRSAGHLAGQAQSLSLVAWDLAVLGHHEQALDVGRRAMELLLRSGDRVGQAGAWDTIGYVQHHLGDYPGAMASYRRAIELLREVGELHAESVSWLHLGDTYQAVGDHKPARDAWQQALDILDQLGHPDADKVRANSPPTTTTTLADQTPTSSPDTPPPASPDSGRSTS